MIRLRPRVGPLRWQALKMPQKTITLYHPDGRTKQAFPFAEVLERQAALGFTVAAAKSKRKKADPAEDTTSKD